MTLERTHQKLFVGAKPDITIDELAAATVELPDEGNGFLGLKFTPKGQEEINAISREHRNKPLAVFLDDKLRAAPVINAQYPHGLMIGLFSRQEAEELVRAAKKKQ